MAKQNVLDDETNDFPQTRTPRTARAGRNTRKSKKRAKKQQDKGPPPAPTDSQIASPAIGGETKKHTSTVWIGCKLPKGLIIQCCEETSIDRPIMGGGVKSVKVFMRTGEQVRLKGYAIPFGKIPNYTIIGDFGLTEVNRDFWERWKAQNSKLDLLVKGLIFVHGEKASVEAYAYEHKDLKCGLEPLNPAGDPRVDKVESDNLTDIEADTDRAKQRKAG